MSDTSRCEREFERSHDFFATHGQREIAAPCILRRSGAGDQAAFLEIAQHAAQVTGVEVERASDIAGCWQTAAPDFVEHPRFAERVGAIEKILAQHADLPRVEAVEAAYGGDPALMLLSGGGHGVRFGQIVDLVKYIAAPGRR